jgi:DNA invertase Pin-like site-specific DNA recombinase
LYAQEFSRLGRNAFDALTTLQACDENKVNVHIQNMNLRSKVNGKANPAFEMPNSMMSLLVSRKKN